MSLPPTSGALPEGVVLHVDDDPAAADLAALDDRLAAFTIAATGHGDPRPLAVFARRDGAVVAGIHGWTWGGCCEVVSFWVDEPQRRQGIGRALIEAAEAEASRRGCQQMVAFTHDAQAPSFYPHAGYELVGRLDDYPTDEAAYWFSKRLDKQSNLVVDAAVRVALSVWVTTLLVAEVVDRIRRLQRWVGHRWMWWWSDLEQRERHDARRTELTRLVVRATQPRGDRRHRAGVDRRG